MMAPENTIPAFELAGRSGFWGIECDTYCTVDGRWIVHHDRTVDRMTDGTGLAKEFTFEAIRSLNIVSGNRIEDYPGLKVPALEEVLEVCKRFGMHAFVEIEQYHREADLESLLGIVKDCGMLENCSFICFNADHLRKVRKLNAQVPLGYLSSKRPSPADLELAKELGHAFLDYWYAETSFKDIERCHEAGVEVSVWTVNTKEEAGLFVKAGVDYITTDTALHE
jgi:glycerophosphoryl diester phosphodiesterase